MGCTDAEAEARPFGHAYEVWFWFVLLFYSEDKYQNPQVDNYFSFQVDNYFSFHVKVFAVDWSPDDEKVASLGRDKVLKQ